MLTTKLQEVERSAIYKAVRFDIFDVVEELQETYDFSKLNIVATWLDSPLVTDSFTVDLPNIFEFGFDFGDESTTTIPLRMPRQRRRKRKPPEFVAPLDEIDTTTGDKQPLTPVKRVVKEMSDMQYSVVVLGGCTSAGAATDGVSGAIGGALIGTVTLIVSMRDKS